MVTVLVATHNGVGRIEHCLESLVRLRCRPSELRVVAIDSASTDATPSVLAGFAHRLPLRTLRCARPGKNAALNLGLDHIEGDLVAFTDDDVVVDRDWLRHLREAAAAERSHLVFGGRITPRWPAPPPAWVLEWVPLGPVFAATPPMPRGTCSSYAVWGPNMAIRSEVFRAGMRFDEAIGPDGSSAYPMGSETSLTRRLAARGARCFHVPDATVEHMIRPAQMTRPAILLRAYRGGLGKGLLSQELEPAAAIADVPRYFFREAAQAAFRFGSARLRGDARGAFQAAWQWNQALGCINGARAAAVSAARSRAQPGYGHAPSLGAPRPA